MAPDLSVDLVAARSTPDGDPRQPAGQDQAPNRREFTLTARNYAFVPERIEVSHDDLVKLTIRGEDQMHSFTVDEYRIIKRVPADTTTSFEFRADRVGTFTFYCNVTKDPGCKGMRGMLVVRPR
jgi:heme/copper-type cytochrome/quinol oxidase subunit 2